MNYGLQEILHIQKHQPCVITFAGAGGKTSLMFDLAQEILRLDHRVITTTTTKMFAPSESRTKAVQLTSQSDWANGLQKKISDHFHVCLGRQIEPLTGKLLGISSEEIRLLEKHSDYILVEGDGSAGLPVKAPEQWEPVIPWRSNIVIYVVGLDCLGRPASSKTVHRIDRFLEVTGLLEDEIIDFSALTKLVTSQYAGLKNIPEHSEIYIALNKSDIFSDAQTLRKLASMIMSIGNDRIKAVIVTGKYGSGRINLVTR